MHEEGSNSEQLGFDLGEEPKSVGYVPNLAEIREDLGIMLERARSIKEGCLWDRRTYRYNKALFPQLTRWLPDDEAQQLCFAFLIELERIELLMAA